MKEINLVEAHFRKPKKTLKFLRGVQGSTILILAFYCVLSAGVFSYRLIIKREREALVKKIEAQESRLADYKKTESLHSLVKERLEALVYFYDQQKISYQQVLSELEDLLPAGATLGGISLDQKGKLTFSGEAENALVMAELLKNLISLEEEGIFKDIYLSSASRKGGGFYSFSLSVDVDIEE